MSTNDLPKGMSTDGLPEHRVRELSGKIWQKRAVQAEEALEHAKQQISAAELVTLSDKMVISTLQEQDRNNSAKIRALEAQVQALTDTLAVMRKLRYPQ